MAKRKPKPRRKQRSDFEGRTRVITAKLTDAERVQWTAAAEREGLTLSEWLRAAAELAIARGGGTR